MFIFIVMWLYPFSFQYTPKSFGDIEVRGIRREIEYVEASFLPSLKTLLYLAALVDRGVIQNDQVREGGLVAFITSQGAMNSASPFGRTRWSIT